MDFDNQQNGISPSQSGNQSPNQSSTVRPKYAIPQALPNTTTGVEGGVPRHATSSSSSSSSMTGVPQVVTFSTSVGTLPNLPNASQPTNSLMNAGPAADGVVAEGYANPSQRVYVESVSGSTVTIVTTTLGEVKTIVKEEPSGEADNSGSFYSPKRKRSEITTSSSEMPVTTLDRSDGGDFGHTVGVYSEMPSLLNGEPLYPRKGRAGLKKSTDTRRNNNRVALRDFTFGRRCVLDVRPIDPPMVAKLKVVNGISRERILRKNKKSMLLDVGQRFGVLQLFVEGHPKPDEKVWVATEKGLVPVPSVAVEHAMTQLTIDVREFVVIASGKVRRDPQKQGTRPKAGEPIIDCFAIFTGDEGRPLWIDSSLITPEYPISTAPSDRVATDQTQLQPQPNQSVQQPQQVPPADPSGSIPDQHGDPPQTSQNP